MQCLPDLCTGRVDSGLCEVLHRLLWCISARGAFTSCTAFLRNMSMQVLKLRAICSHCRKEAAFTHRIGHEEDVEVKPTQACLGVLPGYL